MASCLASGAGYPGSFAASTSTFSMTGGLARRSPAFAMSAAATRPDRCAWRPGSSGNASKMPKMRGPRRSANHAVVAGSSWTSARPPFRNDSTSLSLPGFASSCTYNATLTMTPPPPRALSPPLRARRPSGQRGDHVRHRGWRRRVLVAGEPVVDDRRGLVESAGQTGGLERRGDLLHLAHEAPRLARVVARRRLGALGQLRLRTSPLGQERVVHALRRRERTDGHEQRGGALGVGGVGHLEGGGRAGPVADGDRLERAALEQGGGALGLAAREVEAGRARATGRRSDEPPVHEGGAGRR